MPALSLRLRTTCVACGNPIPMRSAELDVVCPSCSTYKRLSASDFQWLMAGSIEALKGGPLTPPSESTPTILGEVGPRPVVCGACQAPITEDALDAAVPAAGLTCACGREIALREVPQAIDPSGWWTALVGETSASAVAPSVEPVTFACPHCGAALQVDGSSRTPSCEFCSTRAFLPDDLWQALHPTPKAEAFYLWVDRTWYAEHLHLKGEQARAVFVTVVTTIVGAAFLFGVTAFIPATAHWATKGGAPAPWYDRAGMSVVLSWMLAWLLGTIVAARWRPRRPRG